MLRAGAGIFVMSMAVMLSACTVYGEHPVMTIADATGGAGFEQGLWRDIQQQNWKELEQHIAGNFVYVTPAGRLERAEALVEIERMRVTDFSMGDVTTEMNGDAFVVAYTITLRGSDGSHSFPNQPQRRMTVWQKQKASWVAIAHSVIGAS
jgi:Domain of unknown function (DUF4440)